MTGLVVHAEGASIPEALGIIRECLGMVNVEEAYRFGFDCGKNGPNTTNCHFSIFAMVENTRAWERGCEDGKKQKAKK